MKKFAAVDSRGYPMYTAQPSHDSDIEDGQVVGEVTMREYDPSIDDLTMITTKYFKDGAWHTIQENTAVLDGLVLKSLPIPCQIVIDGVKYMCEDGFAELEFVYPNTYQIAVQADYFKDKKFTVTI